MLKRIVYNDLEILTVVDNTDTAITYTAEKVLIATVEDAKTILAAIGVNSAKLDQGAEVNAKIPTWQVIESITNHPVKIDHTRTAQASKMPAIDLDNNSLSIFLRIRTFDSAGNEVKSLYREVVLVADNTTILSDGSGEYNYIIGLMNQGVTIEQIIRSSIQNRSSDGTIDRKLGLA